MDNASQQEAALDLYLRPEPSPTLGVKWFKVYVNSYYVGNICQGKYLDGPKRGEPFIHAEWPVGAKDRYGFTVIREVPPPNTTSPYKNFASVNDAVTALLAPTPRLVKHPISKRWVLHSDPTLTLVDSAVL